MDENNTKPEVLLVVASKHGSTSEIAGALAAELKSQGLGVDLRDLQKGEEIGGISGYEAVILGSAVYAGSWLPQARHFVEQHHLALSITPLWLFSSGPLGPAGPKTEIDPATLNTSAKDLNVKDHRVFLGKLDQSEVSFAERMIVKMVKAPFGDYRDWEQVRSWAQEIAGQLRPAVGAS